MRVLDRNAEISTRYGGAFVQSIDGIEGARPRRAPLRLVLLCERALGAGGRGRVLAARRRGDLVGLPRLVGVGAGVGAWSAPGHSPSPAATKASRHPTAVACPAAARPAPWYGGAWARAGAALAPAGRRGRDPRAGRALARGFARTRTAAADRGRGPGRAASTPSSCAAGGGLELVGLDESGDPARRLRRGAGLVAATRQRRRAAGLGRDRDESRRSAGRAAAARRGGAARPITRWPSEGGAEIPLPVGAGDEMRSPFAYTPRARARSRRPRRAPPSPTSGRWSPSPSSTRARWCWSRSGPRPPLPGRLPAPARAVRAGAARWA